MNSMIKESIEKEIELIKNQINRSIEYKISPSSKSSGIVFLYSTITSEKDLIDIVKKLGPLDNLLKMNGYEIRIKTDNAFSGDTVYWRGFSCTGENYIRVTYYR